MHSVEFWAKSFGDIVDDYLRLVKLHFSILVMRRLSICFGHGSFFVDHLS